MIINTKVLFSINKYYTVTFIIVYVCKTLTDKTSEDSLTGVSLSETRFVRMEKVIFVYV